MDAPVPPLRLSLLGPVRIHVAGEDVTARLGRREIALLAYLAAGRGARTREPLADLLWQDRPHRLAQSNLRTLLTRVRKRFGAYVHATRREVGLAAEAPWSADLTDFQGLVHGANALPNRLAIGQIERALRLQRGPFLDSFHLDDAEQFEAWARDVRRNQRTLVADARRMLAAAYEGLGNLPRAAEETRILVREEPLDEALRGELMRRLALAGDRAEAVQVYEEGRALLRERLGAEPGRALEARHREVRRGDFDPPGGPGTVPAVPHNLPPDETPFLDRPAELRLVQRALREPGHRLVTLTGPGGAGKSRLAIAAARRLAADHPHGVRYAVLAGATQPLPSAIAAACFGEECDVDWPELAAALADHALLLVLDGMDDFVADAAALADFLRAVPFVVVLATSRRPLGLRAERVVPVEGLPVPPAGTAPVDAASYPSVALFTSAAAWAGAPVLLDATTTPFVRAICAAVDGLPLGIEIAGSRAQDHPLESLARNVHQLTAAPPDWPERHLNLETVFLSTWGELSRNERAAAAACSVFAGPFTATAAEAVGDIDQATLTTLAKRSLLRRDGDRFAVREAFRPFARARLRQESAARFRHAEHCLGRRDPGVDAEDVIAAWEWTVGAGDFEGLQRAWTAFAAFVEAERLGDRGAELLELARDVVARERPDLAELAGALAKARDRLVSNAAP